MNNIRDKVAIVGMGCTKFGENWDKSDNDLIIDATYEAYEDAGIGPKDIQAAFVGTLYSGATGACLAEPLRLEYIPITRIENNCNTGLDAIRVAAFSIAAGMYDVVLVVGFEKLKDCGYRVLPNVTNEAMHPVMALGITGPGLFALAATKYFEMNNLTINEGKRILGKIAVKNHHNGSLHPKAMFRREVSLEQVVNAPPIAWPLGLFDCCPTTDGAAAAILTKASIAKNYRDDYILIKGLGLSVGIINPWRGKFKPDVDITFWTESSIASQQAYEQAGVKNPRKEIDIAEIHDCFTIAELIEYESMGFSPRGKAREDVEAGTFTLEKGELAVNADGGLKSFGHPIGASGIRMTYEVYKQLQGKAGPRQLKDVRLGLASTRGGVPGTFESGVNVYGRRD